MEQFPKVSGQGVSEAYMLIREYRLYFDGLGEVRFKIWQNNQAYGGDWYSFTQSHYFNGPKQAGPYITSAPFGATEELALWKAATTITHLHNPNLATDDSPSENWLVKNEDY